MLAEPFLSNVCYIVSYFEVVAYQRFYMPHCSFPANFFSEGCVCDICVQPRLPCPCSVFTVTTPASLGAPSSRPFVPNGSLMRNQAVQVYNYHPPFPRAVLLTSLLLSQKGSTPRQCPDTHFLYSSRRPDYSLFDFLLYGLPEDPVRCPLLSQT